MGALIGSCIGGGAAQIGSILGRGLAAGIGGLTGIQKQIGMSYSRNVTTQYLDRFAQYAEQLLEQHIERAEKGKKPRVLEYGGLCSWEYEERYPHSDRDAPFGLFGR